MATEALESLGVPPLAPWPSPRPPDEPGRPSEPGSSSSSSAPDTGRSPERKWADDWAEFRGAMEDYAVRLEAQATNTRVERQQQLISELRQEMRELISRLQPSAGPTCCTWCWPRR
ncbi:hypothetical protein HYH03_010873 [Edaphochlamys debaryana]|uniref:Uncharacterized protein n=1 Tax=Edaphochlamys debaryana TaxID=47281 RepID=A0A835XYE9_9CHLO|nr:hypothetical protein HYH03_010873 [Edaphochlamys debaryana]|eukprot:KAG2490716.1 hypothetical protein HYH03_010873 [Edaphochlamys debaryana]